MHVADVSFGDNARHGNSNSTDASGSGVVSDDGRLEQCLAELAKLRVLTALALPVLFAYSLYYLRSVDKFAFYVRMLRQIVKDFAPFLIIFMWFLMSITAGFWSLKCSISQAEGGNSWQGFAALLHSVSLMPFETQAPNELEECFQGGSTISSTAHMLFWYLVFLLPILSLNALIAIMNNSFQNVSRRHQQQHYKEWAQIIGDVIRQWPQRKRTEWEQRFYWIHMLKPQKSSVLTNL
jgi:hypothetical protein